MNNYKEIVKELNDLAAKIDAMDKREETPNKYPEGILAVKGYGMIYKYKTSPLFGTYQDWCKVHLGGNLRHSIHSVKNSNGEVFTVGDFIPQKGNIQNFQLGKDGIYASMKWSECESSSCGIDDLTKYIKETLFQTEDGFEYDHTYPKKVLFSVSKHDFKLSIDSSGQSTYTYWYFKEKSNAEKFVAENKKSISYKELKDFLNNTYRNRGLEPIETKAVCDYMREILDHFKPKTDANKS